MKDRSARERSAFLGQNRAGSLASEHPAENEPVPGDETVDHFGDQNHSRDPKEEPGGNQQRDAQSKKTDRTGSAVDPAGRGDTMDRFKQVLPCDAGGEGGGTFVFQGDHLDDSEPVEPGEETALERAEWTIAVVEEDILHGEETQRATTWESTLESAFSPSFSCPFNEGGGRKTGADRTPFSS